MFMPPFKPVPGAVSDNVSDNISDIQYLLIIRRPLIMNIIVLLSVEVAESALPVRSTPELQQNFNRTPPEHKRFGLKASFDLLNQAGFF